MCASQEIVEAVSHSKSYGALRKMLDLDLEQRRIIIALEQIPKIGSLVRVFHHADIHRGAGRKSARKLRGARTLLN